MTYFIIYKTTNTLNQKYYVGKHKTDDLNDGYLGSGLALNRAIKKYGKDVFKREILFLFDNQVDMENKEKEIVNEQLLADPLCYNIGIGGQGGMLNNKGTLTAFDLETNNWRKVSVDTFNKNRNTLKGGTYNQVTVKDKDGNIFNVSKLDPRYLSGELLHVSTGRKHSEETLNKIRQRRKEQIQEYNPHIGRINVFHSEHGFKKIFLCDLEAYVKDGWIKKHPSKNTVVLHKDGRNTRVTPCKVNEMISAGWSLGGKPTNRTSSRRKRVD